ncbi:MAG: hypothetical protein FWG63_12085 [Defluviitaleaceae bacterium]|nr:hypothetical protein [Defluviitaleaceae bacterium]
MLLYFVIIPVLIAIFLFVFATNDIARKIAIAFQAIFTGFAVYLVWLTRGESVITFVGVGSYIDYLGILLYAYDVSAAFVLLTAVVFLVISMYSFNESSQSRFWCMLFLLEGALVGLFLTRDLFNMFVLLEVSTLVIIILMMYYRARRNMFTGMVYLMVNIFAMQLYLFGLAYIYMIGGTFDIFHLADTLAYVDQSDLVLPYALMLTGISFKAGMIPLFSVVPKMRLYPDAPTSVVAILSGVQIKVAIFLLMRMQEMFGSVAQYDFFLIMGIVTGATGVVMAISQSNAKMILAYHTVSQAGLIMIGLSASDSYAMVGGLYHIVGHGIFKSTLFLTAGIIRRSYGTMDVYAIRGVLKRMPIVGVASGFAVLAIMGAPFFIGSISKYYLGYTVDPWIEWSINIISLGTIISFLKYGSMLFGKDPGLQGDTPTPDKWRVVPSVFMGFLCLAGGLLGAQTINFLFSDIVAAGNLSITVAPWTSPEKLLVFFGSTAVGLVIYKYVVKGNKTLKKLSQLDFRFKTVIVSTIAFWAILMVVVGML